MGVFDSIGGAFLKYNPISAIPYYVGDKMDILGVHAQEGADKLSQQQAGLRDQAKRSQYDLLGQKTGPSLTPQMEARLKALESESNMTLMNDPNFQLQQRQATTGGAQALSAIQNKQAASGATGGFSNVGSMSDVYDRLGTQLATLGQQQQVSREAKRDTAAQSRQAIADAQIQYNNAIIDAKMAIESGDARASQDALNRAYAAKAQIDNNVRQTILGIGSLGVSAMTGMPSMGGGQQQQPSYVQNQGQGPTMENFEQMQGGYGSGVVSNGTSGYSKPAYQLRGY